MTRSVRVAVLLSVVVAGFARAQLRPLPPDGGANGLALALRHLVTSGRVLYVTAHPDDENNGVLVLLGRERGLDTGLLTLTRGDGGQNEIGPELFQALGILRTEELAAIHRYDHAEQFFSRAYEFGYSFSVEETFAKWGREETLKDTVRVVRAFRPDVILTLPLEASGGGMHHQAAGQLAVAAFRAAADPARFPDQVAEGLRPWQAAKVYQGAVGIDAAGGKAGGLVAVDTSAYDPLLGMSAHQYGLLARTMHKCQGAGQIQAGPGSGSAVYALVDSEPKVSGAEADLLTGVDTSLAGLARFAHPPPAWLGQALAGVEGQARRAIAAQETHAHGPMMMALRAGLASLIKIESSLGSSPLDDAARYEILYRLKAKRRDFEAALLLAHGLSVEAIADDGDVVRGQTFTVKARVWNQGTDPVRIDDLVLRAPAGWAVSRKGEAAGDLPPDHGIDVAFQVTVGPEARYSQPYWRRDPKVDRYRIDVPQDETHPWSPPDVVAVLRFSSFAPSPLPATVEQPVFWRYEGRWVGGEKQKVVNVVPALAVTVAPEIAVVSAGVPARREFRVTTVNDTRGEAAATVRLEAPAGWTVEPREAPLRLRYEGEEATTRFFVTPPATVGEGRFEVRAAAVADGQEFREGYQVIAYDHIQERHLFHPAVSRVEAIDVKVAPGASIGYVLGTGDEVPAAIEQLGARLTFLTPDDLAFSDLSGYSTIVTGIRAYQARKDLRASNERLLQFARDGGHVVVQYNKFEFNRLAEPTAAGGFAGEGATGALSPFAPYPAAVTSNRVTDENAPVRILVPDHPLFRTPNAIGAPDWEGWVQERGLYFLDARDPRYVELLASTDPFPKNPGEKKGILVEAPVGKGTWTYVGLGLWRQLPAGTPGAYRLLANLLSRPRQP